MKKRIAVFLAALTLLLPLAACAQGIEEPPMAQPTQESVHTSTETSAAHKESSTTSIFVYYPDDQPDPLGDWLGLQLLSEEDRASFPSIFGVTERIVPFYEYCDDDGALQLELYYDTVKEEGVGIITAQARMKGFLSARMNAALGGTTNFRPGPNITMRNLWRNTHFIAPTTKRDS